MQTLSLKLIMVLLTILASQKKKKNLTIFNTGITIYVH